MANTQVTSLICNNFGGIRRKDASFSDEKITCSDCQNVELYFTDLNGGVGLRTSLGNTNVHEFDGEEIYGIFESNQGGEKVIFIYTEDAEYGHLYKSSVSLNSFEEISLYNTLTANHRACGVDFSSGYNDYFIFSNGKQTVFLYTDTTAPVMQIKQTDRTQEQYANKFDQNYNLIGTEGEIINGLGLAVFDRKLWIFNGHTLYYSYTGDPTDFRKVDSTTPEASAGYIMFTKPITAIDEYLGSLAVFHKDSSCLVQKDGSSTVYAVGDDSPGGCADYNSLIFHGTDLYFYDDTKKGVFAFSQVVNGDKTLTDNIAKDIQNEFMQITNTNKHLIRSFSIVTDDRNEVWFIVPTSQYINRTVILIFDYLRGEWIKRYSNHINCLLVHMADLYSGGFKLYKEYQTNAFDGEFIDAYYTCSNFNYGTDNTLKITKYPPRLTVNIGDVCDFWVEYVRNYDISKTPKTKEIKGKGTGKVLIYDYTDDSMAYDSNFIYKTVSNAIAKLPSVTFKALEISFKTKNEGEGFDIKNIEFSKLKIKQV